jgi:hypothetical protein
MLPSRKGGSGTSLTDAELALPGTMVMAFIDCEQRCNYTRQVLLDLRSPPVHACPTVVDEAFRNFDTVRIEEMPGVRRFTIEQMAHCKFRNTKI